MAGGAITDAQVCPPSVRPQTCASVRPPTSRTAALGELEVLRRAINLVLVLVACRVVAHAAADDDSAIAPQPLENGIEDGAADIIEEKVDALLPVMAAGQVPQEAASRQGSTGCLSSGTSDMVAVWSGQGTGASRSSCAPTASVLL